jgi:Right handed beta helix region
MHIVSMFPLRRAAAIAVGTGGLVAGMILAVPGTASATTLTCGSTISSPGTVTLTANGDCTTDTTDNAITIAAAGVTLNLNGHKILGPGAASTQTEGVFDDGYGDLTVENGTISNFYAGVVVEGTSSSMLAGIVVEHLTITNNALDADTWGVYGGYLDGASIHNNSISDTNFGVELDYNQTSTVSENHLTRIFYDALEDYLGTGNTWSYNTLTGIIDVGVYADEATAVVVNGNKINGTPDASGVSIYDSTASVRSNTLNDLFEGIYDDDANFGDNAGDTFSYNHGTGNQWGISAYQPDDETYSGNNFSKGIFGIETDYPSGMTLKSNTTDDNSEAGVFLYIGGEDPSDFSATLTYNTANDNRYGLYSQFPTTGSPNHAKGNTSVNCYNVTCPGSGAAPAVVAPPPHIMPAQPPTPSPRAKP